MPNNPSYTTLKGVSKYGEQQLSSLIEDGIVQFFDWGLLETGAFFNVNTPTGCGKVEFLMKVLR